MEYFCLSPIPAPARQAPAQPMPQAWPPKGIIAQGATYSVNSSEHVLHRTRRVSLPPAVKWPRAASSTAILRSDRRWRCSSFANATVSGFASAYVLRPLHLPVAAFLRSRATSVDAGAGAAAPAGAGQGLRADHSQALAVLAALLWRFHNTASGKCFPS